MNLFSLKTSYCFSSILFTLLILKDLTLESNRTPLPLFDISILLLLEYPLPEFSIITFVILPSVETALNFAPVPEFVGSNNVKSGGEK